MMVVAVVFSFAIAYIAHRGVNGSTAVNVAINVIQISALIVFAVLALGYRANHPAGSQGLPVRFDLGRAYTYEFATTDEDRRWHGHRYHRSRRQPGAAAEAGRCRPTCAIPRQLSRRPTPRATSLPMDAKSVVGPHKFSWVFLQATVAILILVGFESVTAMGGEAKNAKRDVPIAVITSLLVQGAVLLPV